MKPRLVPERTGIYGVVLLLIAAFVFGKVQGGFVPWFLFYAFLVVAVYELLVYAFALRKIEIRREFSHTRQNAGGRLQVQLTFVRSNVFPLTWLWVEDRVPEGIGVTRNLERRLLFPWFKRRFAYAYTCDNVARGRYQWGDVVIQSGDFFGLVVREKIVKLPDEVLIYPRVRDLADWHATNEQNTGATFARANVSEDVTSFIGVRDYIPGDRLSRIHWKATARGMGLKTKEFELEITADVMMLLDRHTRAYGSVKSPLFERAVSLTASLGRYALNRHFTVGLISHGERRSVFPASQHKSHLYAIYEHLAEVEANSAYPLDNMLVREVEQFAYGTTVICITPQLDVGLLQAVGLVNKKSTKMVVYWVREPSPLSEREDACLHTLRQLGVSVRIVQHDSIEYTGQRGDGTSA